MRTTGASVELIIDGEVGRSLRQHRADGDVAPLLDAAAPNEGTDHGTVYSGDGSYTASIPLDWLRRGRLDAGRLWLPDPPTHCWNVKDVVRIEITRGAVEDTVPRKG